MELGNYWETTMEYMQKERLLMSEMDSFLLYKERHCMGNQDYSSFIDCVEDHQSKDTV